MYINMTEAPLCYDAKQNGKALYYSNSFMLNLRWQIPWTAAKFNYHVQNGTKCLSVNRKGFTINLCTVTHLNPQ